MSLNQSDYNKGGMIAFVFSLVVSLVVFVYVSFFSGGVDLKEVDEKALAVEQTVAGADAAAAPQKIDVSNVTEPWIPTDDLIAHGKQLYQTNCAMCHGPEGRGDGPAGLSLNPRPRNLVEGNWKKGGGRLGLFRVLQEGIPGTSMQSYKHLPVVDRWALVHFIQSITENKGTETDADVNAQAPGLQ